MRISPYGRPQTTIIALLGLGAAVVFGWGGWWAALGVTVAITVGLLAFFRDPQRAVPTGRGQVVAPADGRVSSVHTVEHCEPLGGPAVCIRIFLSILDVHVNRAPLHGRVASVTHRPGRHLNALRAESAERNESVTVVLEHPALGRPEAAVRQVAGAIARRIVCGVKAGDIVQRGQRYGMIKFGSTTELYLPDPQRVKVEVEAGRYVYGGRTIVAVVAAGAEEPGGPKRGEEAAQAAT